MKGEGHRIGTPRSRTGSANVKIFSAANYGVERVITLIEALWRGHGREKIPIRAIFLKNVEISREVFGLCGNKHYRACPDRPDRGIRPSAAILLWWPRQIGLAPGN
jgi:hypothetical protein